MQGFGIIGSQRHATVLGSGPNVVAQAQVVAGVGFGARHPLVVGIEQRITEQPVLHHAFARCKGSDIARGIGGAALVGKGKTAGVWTGCDRFHRIDAGGAGAEITNVGINLFQWVGSVIAKPDTDVNGPWTGTRGSMDVVVNHKVVIVEHLYPQIAIGIGRLQCGYQAKDTRNKREYSSLHSLCFV